VQGDSCTLGDYATPAVAVGTLPALAGAITTSLGQRAPGGNTPTSAALAGAINRAQQQLAAAPGHTVAVLFATDGLPTECDTNIQNIKGVAAQGAAAGVKTFVIGVFAQNET